VARRRPGHGARGVRRRLASIAAALRAPSGNTEVTLHAVEGRLHELEIWAGAYGVRARVDVAEPEYERG
jgi:hypothetical protein